MKKGAILDETSRYRYQLWRIWDESKPLAVFIMLNPSTADASEDDPTIRRCIGFAKSWCCGGIKVVNLFAYRATNPKELAKVTDPVGPENHLHIISAMSECPGVIIAAWGSNVNHIKKGNTIIDLLKSYGNIYCLDQTKDGHPRHPLYLRADLKPIRWAM